MALGIDIYRYQTVTDWSAVTRHGVSFVYVKGTDGGRVAQQRADGQVKGAQDAGLPVGLYHYAQLSPKPEIQADVFTAEILRLGATGLPPALDLEDPHKPGAAAWDFAHRFLTRLRTNGFQKVTLYANTSMLAGIQADTLGVPNTLIWAAAYGPNDGQRHPLAYRGRVDIHQFTSEGTIPGITGRVDLNESFTEDIPTGDDDVALSQEDVDRVAVAVWEQHKPHLDPNNGQVAPMWVWTVGANMGAWASASRPIATPEEYATATVELIRDGVSKALAEELKDVEVTVDVEAIASRTAERTVSRMMYGPDGDNAVTVKGTES